MMDYQNFFTSALDRLQAERRYRVFADIERLAGRYPQAIWHSPDGPRSITVWCSNDYLGMGQHPKVLAAMHEAIDRAGAGSGGGMRRHFSHYVSRIGFSAATALIGAVFALPLVWFLFAPFNPRAELGLTVPELPDACVAALAEVLPDISQAQNPLDVTGIATSDPMLPVQALETMLSEPLPYIEDEGFTARVMQRLPPRKSAVARLRAFILLSFSTLAALLVLIHDPLSRALWQAFEQLTRPGTLTLSPLPLVPVVLLAMLLWAGVTAAQSE